MEWAPATDGTDIRIAGFTARLVGRMRRAYCGLHGHDNLLQFEQDRMFLKCVSCGHETPGWVFNEAPPSVLVRSDARRPALIRPRLVSERKIA